MTSIVFDFKKVLACLSLLMTLALASVVDAAINLSSLGGNPYEQDFDSLTSSNQSSGLGTAAWANDSTLPGWSLFKQPAPGTAVSAYGGNSGSNNSGGFWSFGTTGDRALGGLGSGNATAWNSPASGAVAGWMAVAFANDTGNTIDEFTVGYDGEQWRAANATAQTMVMEYGFGSTFDTVASWTAPGGSFDFTSPTNTTGGALDGNSDTNRVADLGGSVSGLSWFSNENLWIRWIENNDAGNDHGLAIDNFSFDVPTVVAGPNINPATTAVNFANRIVNTAATQAVTLNEVGNEPANYTSSFSGDATVVADGSGSIGALGSGLITVGMNVASAGAKSGTVTIDDGNPDVDEIAVSGNVFDSSSARFLSNGTTTLSLNFGTFAQGSGIQSLGESIENAVQTFGFTAGMDFDSISLASGDGGVLSTDLVGGQFVDLAAGNSHAFQALFDTSNAPGVYSATYTLDLSDADSYEGASAFGSQLLTLELTGTIGDGTGVLAGDYNGDLVVDAADYVLWRDNLGATGTLANDVDGGTIGQPQYETWKANFGATLPLGSAAGTAVPEPTSVGLLIAAAISFGLYTRTRKNCQAVHK